MIKLKLIMAFTIWLSLSPVLYSQSTKSCKVLLKEISSEYKGKCLDGLAHGKGKAKGKDSYIGSFKNGLPDGRGKYIFENGNVYNGYWKNGIKHGKGQFNYSINGVSYIQKGYWQKGEYVGTTNPDITYRVTGTSGIVNHEVTRREEHNDIVVISVVSAITKYVPSDIKVSTTSGQVMQAVKRIEISNMFYPCNIEVSYSIKMAQTRKLCKFQIEILEKGKYEIVLYNCD